MVHIFSKGDGPRREDVEARRIVAENRGTIEALANRFTGGRLNELRKPFQKAEGGSIFAARSKLPQRSHNPEPYVRISPNRRVVVVDAASNLQLHFLGEVRAIQGADQLVLATRENGFFGPLDEELRALLDDLDGFPLPDSTAEEDLKAMIAARLGFAPNEAEG